MLRTSQIDASAVETYQDDTCEIVRKVNFVDLKIRLPQKKNSYFQGA